MNVSMFLYVLLMVSSEGGLNNVILVSTKGGEDVRVLERRFPGLHAAQLFLRRLYVVFQLLDSTAHRL